MASHSASVAFAPLLSSLANLPPSLTSMLNSSHITVQDVVLELNFKSSKRTLSAFCGWTGFSSLTHDRSQTDFIELDPAFAKSIGLSESTRVRITVHVSPPEAHVVHLEPASSDDWAAVELHSGMLETTILSQIRAISPSQPVILHVTQTMNATLNVTSIEPPLSKQLLFAKLSPNAEIVVAPKPAQKTAPKTAPKTPASVQGKKSVSGSSRRPTATSDSHSVFRSIALPHPYFDDEEDELQDEDDCVFKEYKSQDGKLALYVDTETLAPSLRTAQHVYISLVHAPLLSEQPPVPASPQPADEENNQPSIASKIVVEVIHSLAFPPSTVGISKRAAIALGLKDLVKPHILKVESAGKPLSRQPKKIYIVPFADPAAKSEIKVGGDKSDLSLEFLRKLALLDGPLSNRQRLPKSDPILPFGGYVEFELADGWILTSQSSSSVFQLRNPVAPFEGAIIESTNYPDLRDVRLFGVDSSIQTIEKSLRHGEGVLLAGASGSGKSAIVDRVCAGLDRDLIYNFRVQCSDFTESRLPVIKDQLLKWFATASFYAPAVIIFEDIGSLFPEELEHVDASRTRLLTALFTKYVLSTARARKVTILATASGKDTVHSAITSGNVISEIVTLKAPDKMIRRQILSEILRRNGIVEDSADGQPLDVFAVADKAEGYLPGDLRILTDRAKHESLVRTLESPDSSAALTNLDFTAALSGYTPASLRGVNLQTPSTTWAEIGGLHETKRVLLETLEWPTKYSPIFESCPLRLRSGLLLYGYPGCGKTFIASAVARECGLNFITIKGPEILNKYIGASEKSVRDLFDRAQAAKPCVLFFDEFDAIAPKRGHDSTGVTDRVVNQMLTQMDGAEGLDGVYVLAATSRPDLIDSALLRPGRIDKSLLCDMPNLDDRADILRVVATKMKIDEDEVDLLDIAGATEGYSGADLQALVYNAHLEAIHDVVDSKLEATMSATDAHSTRNGEVRDIEYFDILYDETSNAKRLQPHNSHLTSSRLRSILNPSSNPQSDTSEPGTKKSSTPEILIKYKHISKALESTKPSISLKERNRLAAVYHEFISGRSGDMPSGTASTDIGGRATLM
ncbi:P-loop containing nucleoside triphosphate hydrolase protein [Myxozyma melibiosi]|uniref:Peroxisomal ATPase PEX1 n=1 Tax=Myxozyma melibiosi TaxID=54550 RepID=A0ABR1EYA2_9ASCO